MARPLGPEGPTMTERDWEYIESRLLSPCTEAGNAYVRLARIGFVNEARELLDAQKVFLDACRKVRSDLQGHMSVQRMKKGGR